MNHEQQPANKPNPVLLGGAAAFGGILGNHFAKQWGLGGFQQILVAGALGGVFGGLVGGVAALFLKKRKQ